MKTELAHNYLQETIALKTSIETSFLTLGERLAKIRDEEIWRTGHESFEEFLVDAKISPATASKLINIYKKFYLSWGFPAEKLAGAGGWSIVARLLPVVKSKEDADEWLLKASLLTRQDLDKEIKEMQTGIDMAQCPHDDTYRLIICRVCHYKEKLYEEDSS